MDPEVTSYKSNSESIWSYNGQRRASTFSHVSKPGFLGDNVSIVRRHSVASIRSLKEKLQKGPLTVPGVDGTRKLKLRRKSSITIQSNDKTVVQTYKKRPNQKSNTEEDWADEVIRMFTMQEVKLHVNDNEGVISLEESLERIENLLLTLSLILIGVATAVLAQFDFSFGVKEQITYKGNEHF